MNAWWVAVDGRNGCPGEGHTDLPQPGIRHKAYRSYAR